MKNKKKPNLFNEKMEKCIFLLNKNRSGWELDNRTTVCGYKHNGVLSIGFAVRKPGENNDKKLAKLTAARRALFNPKFELPIKTNDRKSILSVLQVVQNSIDSEYKEIALKRL